MNPSPIARNSAVPALAGFLTAGVSVGISILTASVLAVRSPVIAVGDAVIDAVPHQVKDFAVATFGTNDKLALISGIYVFLAIFAVVVGLLAWKRPAFGYAALVTFGVVGITTSFASPDPQPKALLPTLLGVFAGGLALRSLRHAAVADGSVSTNTERRAFLKLAATCLAIAAASAALGTALRGRLSAAASRAAVLLPKPFHPLPEIGPGADFHISGLSPFVTPNDNFYRIDTALLVPQVTTDTWKLYFTGMVNKPFSLTYDELLKRPMTEYDVSLTCVSNEVGGELAGNARWLGVPLRDLLDEAGVDANTATQVVGRSVDGFACGFPTVAAYDGRDAFVAVAMNGEALPIPHGFPARLVVAGLYGYVSATKWLKEIELTTMETFDSYWVKRGWAKEAPIKTQSRIDVPRSGSHVRAGKIAVAGVAWAQSRGVQKVEVRMDDGDWMVAQLSTEVSKSSWRQWFYEWDAAVGSHTITVRATDDTGATQTSKRADPIPDGATGWHSTSVTVL